MAESSERESTPDEAAPITAARDPAFVLHEGARLAIATIATIATIQGIEQA